MRGSLCEVERLNLCSDRADQTFAHGQFGDMDSRLIEPARGEEFQYALSQQIDGAHFTVQRLTNQLNGVVQFGLRASVGGDNIMQSPQNFSGGLCGGGWGRGRCAHIGTKLADRPRNRHHSPSFLRKRNGLMSRGWPQRYYLGVAAGAGVTGAAGVTVTGGTAVDGTAVVGRAADGGKTADETGGLSGAGCCDCQRAISA